MRRNNINVARTLSSSVKRTGGAHSAATPESCTEMHPDQIPENPVVEKRLKPLEDAGHGRERGRQGLHAATEHRDDRFTAVVQLNNLLSDEERRKVLNGTAEERTAVLKSLEPEKRVQSLLEDRFHLLFHRDTKELPTYTWPTWLRSVNGSALEPGARVSLLQLYQPPDQAHSLAWPDPLPDR